MKEPTQADRVLARLTRGPMCSMEPLDWWPRITRTAARVGDLKRRGFTVMASPCDLHRNADNHVAYRLMDDLPMLTPEGARRVRPSEHIAELPLF